MRKLLLLLTIGILVVSPLSAQEREIKWYEETVWYLLFVRSFYDSDGDGIGDLRGVIEKLDYLNDGDPNTTSDLGITGIWLMPIMSAESYHGYDTVNYRQVERDYGTADDFRDLIEAAHARGIRVVVDFVINHTSDQHPWFISAQNPDSPYRDWYVWSDERPTYQGPWGQNVWYQGTGNQYYYAVFWDRMPDLNHDNPAVREEIFDTARFWLEDMGADGFRLDAIRYVIEVEVDGRPILADSPANRQYMAEFNTYVHSVNPDAMTVGEILVESSNTISKYTEDGSVDTAFEFDLMNAIISAAQSGNKRDIERQLVSTMYEFEAGTFATLTGNHDFTRLMNALILDEGKNRVAANLLLTLPGIPYIYYGEEIGMTGTKPDENIRRPFQWDDSATGGFTTGTPWEPLQTDYQERTVAEQTNDPNSLLSHYRSLIHLRNGHDALQFGETLPLDSNYRTTYAYLRYTDDEVLLIVHNFDSEAATDYAFSLDESPFRTVSSIDVLFGTGEPSLPSFSAAGGLTDYVPFESLPPQSMYVLRLNP